MVQTVEGFQKEFMTLEEAAQARQVKLQTFYDKRWRERMGINLYSFTGGRRKFVRRAEVFALRVS